MEMENKNRLHQLLRSLTGSPPCVTNTKTHQFLVAARDGLLDRLKILAGEFGFGEGLADVRGGYCRVTALHLAARGGYLPICEYLTEELRFHVDVQAQNGETPLYWACLAGKFVTSRYLIERGAGPNKPKCDACTPLHAAVVVIVQSGCSC